MTYVASATKVITSATPTVDLDGNVIKWEVSLKYSLNGYESTFNRQVDVEPTKAPEDFSKTELLALIDVELLDAVYDQQYESTQVPVEVTETKIDNFDVNSLA